MEHEVRYDIRRSTEKVTVGYVFWTVFKYFTLILFSFISVLPIVSCVITAFKSDKDYANSNVMSLPRQWMFSNFVKAFKTANMGRAFLNSAIILVFVLLGSVLIGTSLAYVLNRFKFRGNSLIRNLFLFASLLPGIAMQVTTYSIMYHLGLLNHLYGYIILMMGTDVISIYIFIQYFENLPVSLDESAILDGANYYQIYWNILLPLLKPAIVTCIILKGANTYNEYYNAHLYLQNENLCTVSISLYTFQGPMGNQYNMICAGVIISLLPALIVFLLCQDQIYNGIAAGAVKG